MGNLYDQLEIDIEQLHRDLSAGKLPHSRRECYPNVIQRILCRFHYYAPFIDSGFIRSWFDEFNEFWSKILHGRPLKFHDFFYLYASYRVRFQKVEVKASDGRDGFLQAWQRHENLYSIFAAAYTQALEPFAYRSFKSYLPPRGRILEYGCGSAPTVTSMIKSRCRGYDYVIADIRNFPYLFAKFRLMQHGVECVDIEPYKIPELSGKFDLIFLQTVMEHLPDPLNVIQLLTDHLNPGGCLIFDYILSDGAGLDTVEAVQMRSQVLDHIKGAYQMVQGELLYNKSMGTTIARKK